MLPPRKSVRYSRHLGFKDGGRCIMVTSRGMKTMRPTKKFCSQKLERIKFWTENIYTKFSSSRTISKLETVIGQYGKKRKKIRIYRYLHPPDIIFVFSATVLIGNLVLWLIPI